MTIEYKNMKVGVPASTLFKLTAGVKVQDVGAMMKNSQKGGKQVQDKGERGPSFLWNEGPLYFRCDNQPAGLAMWIRLSTPKIIADRSIFITQCRRFLSSR